MLIDDIVLFDAAAEDEKHPFPKHILYTGWFKLPENTKKGLTVKEINFWIKGEKTELHLDDVLLYVPGK